MNTENLSTLKIHKLTQAQYERELDAGRIDENALYLTPDIVPDVIIEKTGTVTKVDFINFGETNNVKTIEIQNVNSILYYKDETSVADNEVLEISYSMAHDWTQEFSAVPKVGDMVVSASSQLFRVSAASNKAVTLIYLADLAGKDGYTPVKGTDYFTEEDKAEMAIDVLDSMPTVASIDFSNFENGSFTETVNGEPITHTVTFDADGRPTSIDGVVITWEVAT